MQIKNTTTYLYAPIIMLNKQTNNGSTLSVKNDAEQMELWYTASVNAKWYNHPGNFLKAHTIQPITPLLGIYSSEIRIIYIYKIEHECL